MRVMVTTCPNQGHFYPMVPLLWALRNAGHDVLAAMPGDVFADLAASAGLPATSLGERLDFPKPGSASDPQVTQERDVDGLIEHVLNHYVGLAERVVDSTMALAERWQPDLVMHPSWEFAGPIAAAALGKPSVLHAWGMKPPSELDAPVADALAQLHEAVGLPDAPQPSRWIDPCPPTLQDGPSDPTAIAVRYVAYNGSRPVPPWLLKPPAVARVCVTLGNIPIMGNHANVLGRTLEALRAFDVETVVAASDRIPPPAELPARTRFVRGLPLSQLLPSCDLVVHHGGAGSTMTAISCGRVQLVLPQMCVQYQHADQISTTGAGLRLDPDEATVDALREAIGSLLDDPRPREVVAIMRAEIAARPPLAEVAGVLASTATDALRDAGACPPAATTFAGGDWR